jgi:hypothetical protein
MQEIESGGKDSGDEGAVFGEIFRLAGDLVDPQEIHPEVIEINAKQMGIEELDRGLHPGNFSRPLIVDAHIDDSPVTVTVDTGSFLSIISESILATFPRDHQLRYDDPLLSRRLRGINSDVAATGIVSLPLKLPTRLVGVHIRIIVDFVVVPNKNKVILLGMDYLQLLGATVDLHTRSLVFSRAQRHLVPLEPPPGQCSPADVNGLVVTAEQKRIRPFHSAMICQLLTDIF